MDSTLTEEEISCLKQKNQNLTFVIGPQCSGISIQTEKVSNEFKYASLNIINLLNKECEVNEELKASKEQGNEFSKEEITKILVKTLIECPNNNIIIENFPKNLEQALYFEQNVLPIKLIIKFNASCETCYKRLIDNGCEIKPEEYEQCYNKNCENIKEIYDFYSAYGITREVDANLTVTEVNIQFKQHFYPIVYSIIGKRYSGKTTLSKVLNAKTGITLFDFQQFKSEKENKKDDNKVIVNKLINKLRTMNDIRVLIENFPQNQEQYSHFVNNCKDFEKIYYLKAENYSCFERLNDLDINDPNYIDSSKLDKLLTNFDKKQSFIESLQKNNNFLEINVNNHQILTEDLLISKIQPYISFINFDSQEDVKEQLFQKLKDKNYNCFEINLPDIIENGKKRKILPEDADINSLSIDCKIQLIKPLLFREKCERVILNTFPLTMEELCEFEKNLCKINKYIEVTESKLLTNIIKTQNSMIVYFYNLNKLTVLNPKELTDYKIEESLDLTKDINIIYGMPMSGKTTMAKHLVDKYGFTLLDFKDLIEQVKKTKIDPENPDAEPEITYEDLVEGFKKCLNSLPKNKKFLIENIFIPNSPETPFLIDTYEKALEIIKIIENFGKIRNLYEVVCNEKTLINKYKTKEGIAEELNEDQKTAFNETLEKPKQLLEEIKKISSNVVKIKCDEPEIQSKIIFDKKNQRNFIVVKHEYDIIIEKTLELFAAKNRLLYINVPKLIYCHFYLNDEYSKKLEANYGKKKFKVEIKDPNNFDELIFYKYNPLNFEKNIVNEVIINYVTQAYKNIESTGNYILLTGYLNYDLVEIENEPYNLPLLELKNVMELGDLNALIQVTRNEIKQIEDEEAVELIIEKPKKEIKRDEWDVDEPEQPPEEEEKPPEEQEEENPDAPKFKPDGLSWTYYDGNPRNYVQVLKRLKNEEISVINLEDNNNLRQELIKTIICHLDAPKDQNYKGVLEIIKINNENEVPTEEVENINSIFELLDKDRVINEPEPEPESEPEPEPLPEEEKKEGEENNEENKEENNEENKEENNEENKEENNEENKEENKEGEN